MPMHAPCPQLLLSPGPEPGRCLPLAGASGYVDIQLAAPLRPSAFSYEHIPSAIAFDIRTAPAALAVYAPLPAAANRTGTPASGGAKASAGQAPGDSAPAAATGMQLLGQLEYSTAAGARAVQTAALAAPPGGGRVAWVRVAVLRNHGHPDYTCLYRLRVHGSTRARTEP